MTRSTGPPVVTLSSIAVALPKVTVTRWPVALANNAGTSIRAGRTGAALRIARSSACAERAGASASSAAVMTDALVTPTVAVLPPRETACRRSRSAGPGSFACSPVSTSAIVANNRDPREAIMRSVWAALFASALCAVTAAAQEFKPDPVDEAAARREGQVTWYTSTPVAAGQHIANEFEKQTGIKVEMLRTGGQNVIRRFMQEAESGRIYVDVITMSDMSAANAMTRRSLFVPFKPNGFDKVVAEAKDRDGHYIAQRLTLVGMVARNDKVAGADLPKTWTDLVQPKYKGLMVMSDPSFTAIQLAVVATLSKKYGWQFYEALRKNDTMVVQGHEQVYDMVKR